MKKDKPTKLGCEHGRGVGVPCPHCMGINYPTPRSDSTRRAKRVVNIDALEADIMDWFYDCVKTNFDVDMVQDATDLRVILDSHLSTTQKENT